MPRRWISGSRRAASRIGEPRGARSSRSSPATRSSATSPASWARTRSRTSTGCSCRQRSIVREAILGQSAFDPNDARSQPAKTYRLVVAALSLHREALAALEKGAIYAELAILPARRALTALRDAAPEEQAARAAELDARIAALAEKGGACHDRRRARLSRRACSHRSPRLRRAHRARGARRVGDAPHRARPLARAGDRRRRRGHGGAGARRHCWGCHRRRRG